MKRLHSNQSVDVMNCCTIVCYNVNCKCIQNNNCISGMESMMFCIFLTCIDCLVTSTCITKQIVFSLMNNIKFICPTLLSSC